MTNQTYMPEQSKLSLERVEIASELEHLHDVIRTELDLELDEGDEQITEHETAAILVAILEQRLHDIDVALAAIEHGEYSRCERCNKEIEPERLFAKPDARFCIRCQKVVERLMVQNSPTLSMSRGFV